MYCNDTGLSLSNNTCNSLIHTFVGVLVPEAKYDQYLGIPSYGLHYEQDTSCPALCGALPCECDALLVDLMLEGTLDRAWDGNNFYLPDWAIHFASENGSIPDYTQALPDYSADQADHYAEE